jgi:hypothetical protein
VKLGIFYLLIGIPFAELLVGFVCCVSEDEEFSLNVRYLLPHPSLSRRGEFKAFSLSRRGNIPSSVRQHPPL